MRKKDKFIYLKNEKINIKSLSQVMKTKTKNGFKISVNFMDQNRKDKTLMMITGKDISEIVNVAFVEIYERIVYGDNVQMRAIKEILEKEYPKSEFTCEIN